MCVRTSEEPTAALRLTPNRRPTDLHGWTHEPGHQRAALEPSQQEDEHEKGDFLSGSRSSNRAVMLTKAAGCRLCNHSSL